MLLQPLSTAHDLPGSTIQIEVIYLTREGDNVNNSCTIHVTRLQRAALYNSTVLLQPLSTAHDPTGSTIQSEVIYLTHEGDNVNNMCTNT